MALADDFRADGHGRRFTDVWNDQRVNFGEVCEFFEDRDRQRRLVESEMHHDRPALAGAVRELEQLPTVAALFNQHGRATTHRFRQAVGVLVRIVMEQHAWHKTGRKGSLGTPPSPQAVKKRHASKNKGGLAMWFNRAERYEQS